MTKDIEERGLGGSTPQLPHRGSPPQSLEGVEELERRLENEGVETPEKALGTIKRWAAAARHDPPPSGLFLADDLEGCANTLADTLSSLRRERDEAIGKLGLQSQKDTGAPRSLLAALSDLRQRLLEKDGALQAYRADHKDRNLVNKHADALAEGRIQQIWQVLGWITELAAAVNKERGPAESAGAGNPSSPNANLSERRTGWDRAIKEAGEIADCEAHGFDIAERIRSLKFDGGGIGGGEKDLGTITAPLTEPQNG